MTRAARWLLAGHLFLGLAYVAVLPPWEGFDETAHYSCIQELADRREVPRLYRSRLSTDVEQYSRRAPLPYSFKGAGALTYETYFAGSAGERLRGRELIHGRPEEPRLYAPGDTPNWQAQHPPLYYLVLSPVYALTRNMSWAVQLLILRLTSYAFAWVALLIGMYACLTATPSTFNGIGVSREWAALGIGLWPVVLTSWFSDMARLGNDSMCALVLAGIWWLTLRASATGLSMGQAVALGALLGAGCLTKVFFVPITVACLGFWLVRAWTLGGTRELIATVPRMAATLLVTGVLAGWWYFLSWREYGVPFGGLELIELRRAGGLLHGLARDNTLLGLPRALGGLGTTLLWPGTWSLVGASLVSMAPIGLTVILAGGAYLGVLRRARFSEVVWFPAWSASLLLVALAGQALGRMALLGKSQPAYYLNLLAPALGAAVGIGMARSWPNATFRNLATGGVAYSLLFGAGIFWAQVMLFSGLVVWYGTDVRAYRVAAILPRVVELPDALGRLTALAYPWAGAAAWLIGEALVAVGLARAWSSGRETVTSKPG